MHNSGSNVLIRWVNKFSKWVNSFKRYRPRMPGLGVIKRHKREEWLDHLSNHPDYPDLCNLLVLRRDRALRKLLKTREEDFRELRGEVRAYQKIYEQLASKLIRP